MIARKLALRGPDQREVVPLTGTEVEVIREVQRHPRSSPTDIAVATGLRRSNVSVAIRVLEAQGMVTKEPSAGDARSFELIATDFALENMEKIRALWVTRLRKMPADLLSETTGALAALQELESKLAH
jgi:DNA-binding MarR family transcriptional regulator